MSLNHTERARISVTLPPDVVQEIDRIEKNRSRFVLEAVLRELRRRKRMRLAESIESPHPESEGLAAEGLEDWFAAAPESDAEDLLVRDGGRSVRWRSGTGWCGEEE